VPAPVVVPTPALDVPPSPLAVPTTYQEVVWTLNPQAGESVSSVRIAAILCAPCIVFCFLPVSAANALSE
jgi:hypothetical protein